ncbi:MAG: DUF438 domain-containing protein [bacterium]
MGLLDQKKSKLKELITQLQTGATPDQVKYQFLDIVKGIDTYDMTKLADELMQEGMPKEAVERLCAVHLAAFKEPVEIEEPIAPPGHPIYILMIEHMLMLNFAHELRATAKNLKFAKDYSVAQDSMTHLQHLATHFQDSEKHYLREENILFPYLEKHGVTQPVVVMWNEHTQIREYKKKLSAWINSYKETVSPKFVKKLELEIAIKLVDLLNTHYHKEDTVLFPTALRVITAEEWQEILMQSEELGYCSFTPKSALVPLEQSPNKTKTT